MLIALPPRSRGGKKLGTSATTHDVTAVAARVTVALCGPRIEDASEATW